MLAWGRFILFKHLFEFLYRNLLILFFNRTLTFILTATLLKVHLLRGRVLHANRTPGNLRLRHVAQLQLLPFWLLIWLHFPHLFISSQSLMHMNSLHSNLVTKELVRGAALNVVKLDDGFERHGGLHAIELRRWAIWLAVLSVFRPWIITPRLLRVLSHPQMSLILIARATLDCYIFPWIYHKVRLWRWFDKREFWLLRGHLNHYFAWMWGHEIVLSAA